MKGGQRIWRRLRAAHLSTYRLRLSHLSKPPCSAHSSNPPWRAVQDVQAPYPSEAVGEIAAKIGACLFCFSLRGNTRHDPNEGTHGLVAQGALVFLDGHEGRRLAQACQGRELLLKREGRLLAEDAHWRHALGTPIRDKQGVIMQAVGYQKAEDETKPGRVTPDRR
jgi:hypothetical protein